jgi:hypothetical protein
MSNTCPRQKLGTHAIVRALSQAGTIPVAVFVLSLLSGTNMTAQPLTFTSRDLLGATPAELTGLLEFARPDSVSPAQRAGVLDTLPEKGEVTSLDSTSWQKLKALTPVLQAAKRQSTYVIKVIDVPQAVIGLHARTVLLISQTALTLLSADELRALVAHEIGHEYVWADYERSREVADDIHLQDLELVCDILAVVTLRTVGQDGSRLVTGIEKLARFNRKRFGTADHESRYPTLARRGAVVRAVEAEFESRHRDGVKGGLP